MNENPKGFNAKSCPLKFNDGTHYVMIQYAEVGLQYLKCLENKNQIWKKKNLMHHAYRNEWLITKSWLV